MMETRPRGLYPQGARRNPDGVRSAEPSMAKHRLLPPVEQLRGLLEHDEGSPTGLRWRVRRKRVAPGDIAGGRGPRGYWTIGIFQKKWYAHRIVWALVHGQDPGDLQIDHINGDRSDNRIENLRLATNTENQQNSASRRGSSSRSCGVSKVSATRWEAYIREPHGKRKRSLGLYRCETAAALAYDRAALEAYGEFARPNILTNPQHRN